MAAIGVAQGPLALIGREREVMAIGGVLDRALTGEAGALVVRGEAGIGKSALLAYACARAGGMTILRATGVEAESDLAFAGLYGLARPVLDKLDELPVTQRDALAGALGLAPSTGADRLLVSAAVLSLLAAAAEECPVLCVIDDAQWFDRPSADALVFSARRLRAERLVMLFGAREGDAQRFEVTDLPEMVIEGLDGRSATAMLGSRADELGTGGPGALARRGRRQPARAARVARGLVRRPAGRGAPGAPAAIPLTPRLQGVFLRRDRPLTTGPLSAAHRSG